MSVPLAEERAEVVRLRTIVQDDVVVADRNAERTTVERERLLQKLDEAHAQHIVERELLLERLYAAQDEATERQGKVGELIDLRHRDQVSAKVALEHYTKTEAMEHQELVETAFRIEVRCGGDSIR